MTGKEATRRIKDDIRRTAEEEKAGGYESPQSWELAAKGNLIEAMERFISRPTNVRLGGIRLAAEAYQGAWNCTTLASIIAGEPEPL